LRIACFYADLHPATSKALAAYAPQAELVETSRSDESSYWRELSARWGHGDDLLVIEQDIEIGPGMVESLEKCPRDWCCYAFNIFNPPVLVEFGLGCTKFSAAARQAAGSASIQAEFADCPECHGAGCGNRHLDVSITRVLTRAGLSPHVHGEVTHHHDYGPSGILRGGITHYSWSPDTGSVYLKGDPGPRRTWGVTGVRPG
jgi:hypothetical protein